MDNNQKAFLALVRAGLWENLDELHVSGSSTSEAAKPCVKFHESVDWGEVYRLASEQCVLGLVLAGIEASNIRPPQEFLLQWIGEVQMLEQQNKAMNGFIGELFEKQSKAGVNALLVKGQGVAQCYERPFWRCCGDIDLMMDGENYERAKELLIPIADRIETEAVGNKHLGLYIKDFLIELHGAMPFVLSNKVDGVLYDVIEKAKTDKTNGTGDLQVVAIPRPDEHVMIVFTHFLQHFFIEGVGLRQVCDWCRLLWNYRLKLDLQLLELRIRKAGLMTEWRAFGILAVEFLGMLREAMPFYDSRYRRRGEWVLKKIFECGNFGHNHDLSYMTKYSGIKYKVVALWRRLLDFVEMSIAFPVDGPSFFVTYVANKTKGNYS